MKEIKYRILKQNELNALAEINLEEKIVQEYYVENEQLKLKEQDYKITCWNSIELVNLIKKLYLDYQNEGMVYGAFVNGDLIGMISLNTVPNNNEKVMLVEHIYISKEYRDQGVGRKLFDLVIEEVKKNNKTKIYIISNPNKSSVDFYLSLGATLNNEIKSDDKINLVYEIN